MTGFQNRQQLPKLVNLPSTKNGDDGKLKLNQMRVKNNFNFNNGHNNAIGKQSRNTNMHNVSSGIKNFNKNITPTTSKVVGNQFEFRNEND